jgi:hypothetical protein
VTHSNPSRKWTDAVERGRQIMRAGLIQQNLPGLSAAVGVDGEIVWAEGGVASETTIEKSATRNTTRSVASKIG